MRLHKAALLAVLLGVLLGTSGEARAAIHVAFVWTATTGSGTPGSSRIDAAPGDQLVGEVRVTPDAGGVGGYGISLRFDTDLGDELDLVSVTEALPAGMFNLSADVEAQQESTSGQMGNVLTFEAASLTDGPTSGTFVAGVVTFDVTANVSSDGNDVFMGAFNTGIDGVGDNASEIVTPSFSNATVNLIGASPPIPMLPTAGLLVVSLLISLSGLWVARRRRAIAQV